MGAGVTAAGTGSDEYDGVICAGSEAVIGAGSAVTVVVAAGVGAGVMGTGAMGTAEVGRLPASCPADTWGCGVPVAAGWVSADVPA
ncbi:hypothetical protein DESA109040_11395 [Deinococcus saxicola]